MDDVYENIEEYDPDKEHKTLIVFDDMVADMLSNQKLDPTVTKLLFGGRKLNIFFVFITQSLFIVPKKISRNYTHYFIMKIPNKQYIQQIAFDHSPDIVISYEKIMNVCKKPYSFLVIHSTIASDNPLSFRKNLLEII